MFLRRCERRKSGKRHTYWALFESYRTARGSRQRVVAYLGDLAPAEQDGWVKLGAHLQGDEAARRPERTLFDPPCVRDAGEEDQVKVRLRDNRLERLRDFGDVWLAWGLWRMPGLDGLLAKLRREGREDVSWGTMAAILGVARFCEPSSELHIEQKWCRRTALEDLLGVPPEKVPADRLYAALDRLLPHKEAIESRLTQRFGELFELKCDLLLYDVTSTCFEGTPKAMLRQFERHLTDQDWVVAQEGVDVKLVPSPDGRRHFFSRGASIGAPRNRRCTRSSSATCRRA